MADNNGKKIFLLILGIFIVGVTVIITVFVIKGWNDILTGTIPPITSWYYLSALFVGMVSASVGIMNRRPANKEDARPLVALDNLTGLWQMESLTHFSNIVNRGECEIKVTREGDISISGQLYKYNSDIVKKDDGIFRSVSTAVNPYHKRVLFTYLMRRALEEERFCFCEARKESDNMIKGNWWSIPDGKNKKVEALGEITFTKK